jgi:hypothetical protein
MSALTDLSTTIPLVVSLAIYFYFKPSFGLETSLIFFGVWILFFVLDAKITISNPNLLRHEKNIIFPFLYYKFGKFSLPLQIIIESVAIVLVSCLFEEKPSMESISVVSLIFGLAHLEAYLANIRTVKKILRG